MCEWPIWPSIFFTLDFPMGRDLQRTKGGSQPDSPLSQSEAASQLSSNHLKYLTKPSVPGRQTSWSVKRVDAFIKAHNDHKIKGLSSSDIGRYLETIGRENRLSGWQFRQVVDAIRILCFAFRVPAGTA